MEWSVWNNAQRRAVRGMHQLCGRQSICAPTSQERLHWRHQPSRVSVISSRFDSPMSKVMMNDI